MTESDSRRAAREARLRELGFEEPSEEQRARNVAMAESRDSMRAAPEEVAHALEVARRLESRLSEETCRLLDLIARHREKQDEIQRAVGELAALVRLLVERHAETGAIDAEQSARISRLTSALALAEVRVSQLEGLVTVTTQQADRAQQGRAGALIGGVAALVGAIATLVGAL